MGSTAITALNFGMRWNPLKGELGTRAVKPYLAASLGPVIGSGASVRLSSTLMGAQNAVTLGGHAGAGVDVLLGRSWSIGVSTGYNWMTDFSTPVGGRNNYSGIEAAVNLGWIFGKGHGPRN